VIDGKQRLLSIRQFCADENDSRDSEWMAERLRLAGLTETVKLNGKTYTDFEQNFPDESMRFENATIRAVLLRKWTSQDFLYTVFYRLNSGSLKLSPQELRQALYPGPFMDYVDKQSGESAPLLKLLNKTKPDRRMVDAELMLRFISFNIGVVRYQGNLKKFLDETAERLTQSWKFIGQDLTKDAADAMNMAISAAIQVFGRNACKKYVVDHYERSVNRALFDVQIHYFADPKLREWQLANSGKTVEAFQDLCNSDPKFIDSVTSTTKTEAAVLVRFEAWGKRLQVISGIPYTLPPAVVRAAATAAPGSES
jgi:hypothetical protein